jgi:serine/threonine protein kinase
MSNCSLCCVSIYQEEEETPSIQRRIVLDMFEGYRKANASKVSLQDRLQDMAGQPFSLEETFSILGQLGRALCYAHECDVTHGNLRPDTIFFSEKGRVLLAEFFLNALATQPDQVTALEAAAYRAPELLSGQASELGDQYALGCIAYEMLTGHKPFMIASMSNPDSFYHTKKPVPPKNFNPALSSLSEEAILNAIAKEPAQRHRDMRSFLTALGIPIDTRDLARSMEASPVSLVSGPPEQADLFQPPIKRAIEEAETLITPAVAIPAQMVHPAQTRVPAEEEGTTSLDVLKPQILVDSISHSPDYYPLARHLFADVAPTNPEINIQTPAYAGPLGINNARFLFKWRWISVVATCLVAICIVATSVLAISVSHMAQEHKAVPTIDVKTEPSPTPTPALPTLTPTLEQQPTIAPLPIIEPTVAVLPTPTPTPRHGRH